MVVFLIEDITFLSTSSLVSIFYDIRKFKLEESIVAKDDPVYPTLSRIGNWLNRIKEGRTGRETGCWRDKSSTCARKVERKSSTVVANHSGDRIDASNNNRSLLKSRVYYLDRRCYDFLRRGSSQKLNVHSNSPFNARSLLSR